MMITKVVSHDPHTMCLCVCPKNKKKVLPCQTSHVQSPLDKVDYGGQGLMISAAGLERHSKKYGGLLLDRKMDRLQRHNKGFQRKMEK